MKIASSLLVIFFLSSLLIAQDKKGDLSVNKIVLYSSGVGYFEHSGTVDGNATVNLVFNAAQINDVLKSLVLRDSTGTALAVNYPSQDPPERILNSFALDLSGSGGLAALMAQLRGQEMVLLTPAEVAGRLVGYEPIELHSPEGTNRTQDLMLTLFTASGLRNIPLSSVSQVQLKDPRLNDELSKALGLLAGLKNEQHKNVTIVFKGTGKRSVTVGYITESPVWKTSYRLDLTGEKPFLQGWAIVENTSEVDWNEVSLSLASGRPVSFIQDLYSPLYVERPVYVPEVEAGPAPKINESGRAPAAAPAVPLPKAQAKMAEELSYDDSKDMGFRQSGVKSAAQGEVSGELFQFTVKNAVTLPRHQSAMIPIVSSDLEAEKVSVYNASAVKNHPMNAVRVTNSTRNRLPAGPVTVFDGGMYAGDSLTDTLVEKDKRIWTYATDLSVLVDSTGTSQSQTEKVTIINGVLTYKIEKTYSQNYHFVNKSGDKKRIMVEHPYNSSRQLVGPSSYEEKTDSYLRFRLDVDPQKEGSLNVIEKENVYERHAILTWDPGTLLALVSSKEPLSASVKQALQKAADLKLKSDRIQRELAVLTQQRTEEENNQNRYRNNISSVGRDSTQGQSYLKKLMDSEQKIDGLDGQIKTKQADQKNSQIELEEYLKNLNLE